MWIGLIADKSQTDYDIVPGGIWEIDFFKVDFLKELEKETTATSIAPLLIDFKSYHFE